MSAISITNLNKHVDGLDIYDKISLDVYESEILVLLGPNGSGKSTLFNILAGLTTRSSGDVHVDKNYSHISYIFQNYRSSLLPWLTNYQNVSLPLSIQEISKSEIKNRISQLEDVFEISFDWESYPYNLSGGQQQILSFFRGLVTNPRLILIDEPFSALDLDMSVYLREHLEQYFLKEKPTILLITHSVDEALLLGTRIAVLSKRPSCVVNVFENPLPYPRKETFSSKEFYSLKRLIVSSYNNENAL